MEQAFPRFSFMLTGQHLLKLMAKEGVRGNMEQDKRVCDKNNALQITAQQQCPCSHARHIYLQGNSWTDRSPRVLLPLVIGNQGKSVLLTPRDLGNGQ